MIWFQRGADQGHTGSLYWLGRLYYEGKGVERNRGKAELLLRQAATQGSKEHWFAAHLRGHDHGAAYCWGGNENGQLGDGTTRGRSRPVPVARDLRFAAVSAGERYTCGITAAGAAYCWGFESHGRLGDGTGKSTSRPVPVASDLRFASLSTGDAHVCGITATGEVHCWGENGQGQLGDGTTTDRSTPVPVVGGVRFAAVGW